MVCMINYEKVCHAYALKSICSWKLSASILLSRTEIKLIKPSSASTAGLLLQRSQPLVDMYDKLNWCMMHVYVSAMFAGCRHENDFFKS